ncbi:PTS sugar transporter subunit IIA [Caulobacter sp. NIBR2454]|uniref:PTS sugar transporter subunit IIA n=1 Tax=Caulobacter sp. NIBR2454 TaxID=3015996 RepID=UPI0022B68081|nr:PTS sugar transporter subunit IIA [Caulobacter sp. NIBR2454]
MRIEELLDRRAISPRSSASNKRQALSVIADIAGRTFGLQSDAVLEALLEREAAGSTGVGQGVAVPHARLEGLDRMRAVVVRLDQPIDFNAVDDQPVDLMVALLAPVHSASTEHLRALARVSRLLRRSEIREQLRQAKSADAMHVVMGSEAAPTAA